MSRPAIYLHTLSTLLLLATGLVLAIKSYLFPASACFVASALLPMWVGDRLTAKWKK